LEDDDVTRIGIDYIHTFPLSSSLKPYAGIGLSTNSVSSDDTNLETGLGGRLRVGAYYTIIPNLDLGAEINYNTVSWENETDNLGREWEFSSSYYGLGVNLNYKF
jgi:opacity protein-like surface antigen